MPTCGPRERLGDVLGRIDAATGGLAVVVDDDRVVIGLLVEAALEQADGEAIDGADVRRDVVEGAAAS